MADQNTTDENVSKPSEFNISALARQYGVHRKTITRWLAKGWRPEQTDGEAQVDVKTEPDILPAAQEEKAHAHPAHHQLVRAEPEIILPGAPLAHLEAQVSAHPLRAPAHPRVRRGWHAAGRGIVGLAIAGTGAWIAYNSIGGNAWFGHSLTPDPTAGDIYSNLSVGAEVIACLIPTANRFYFQDGDWRSVLKGRALMAVALVVVFFAAGGFAVTNISAGVEAKAERTTPRIEELKHEIEGLDKTITSLNTSIGVPGADGVIHQGECAKRGPKCDGLEAQRKEANDNRKAANDKLDAERSNVKADADPAANALGISSTKLRLAQGGAMVALCLCSGLFISFGAGLIWPRG